MTNIEKAAFPPFDHERSKAVREGMYAEQENRAPLYNPSDLLKVDQQPVDDAFDAAREIWRKQLLSWGIKKTSDDAQSES